MDVTRYTFQSPYPNQIQIGQVDPSTKQQEEQNSEIAKLNEQNNDSLRAADSYNFEQKQGIKSAVNASENTLSALTSFNQVNTQTQALAAYSG
jgi:hypothetical protein